MFEVLAVAAALDQRFEAGAVDRVVAVGSGVGDEDGELFEWVGHFAPLRRFSLQTHDRGMTKVPVTSSASVID